MRIVIYTIDGKEVTYQTPSELDFKRALKTLQDAVENNKPTVTLANITFVTKNIVLWDVDKSDTWV